MAAVKLIPACKDYLWGGTRLKTEYNKESDLDIMAEAWELSNHKDGQSRILGGECDGDTFQQYLDRCGTSVLGENCKRFDYFPVLIKLIDAARPLSVQVHPDNEYAMKVEGEYGKTEMWYILDCVPGAFLYYGVNRELSKEELEERIKNDTVLEVLNKVQVKKGDVFFIEAGTLHAIGAGIVICEIQQNSNTTYRVYDYGRVDKNGNARELHIQKALDVAVLKPAGEVELCREKEKGEDCSKERLAVCKYFKVHHIQVKKKYEFVADASSFVSLTVIEGEGVLASAEGTLELRKGDSIFVPAQEGKCTVTGKCQLIQTVV